MTDPTYLAPRGEATITSDNRAECRRALCALGLPSAYVRGLTLTQLSAIYNDTADRELSAALEANLMAPGGIASLPLDTPPPQSAAKPATAGPDPEALQRAAQALAALMQPAAVPIDAEAVRAKAGEIAGPLLAAALACLLIEVFLVQRIGRRRAA